MDSANGFKLNFFATGIGSLPHLVIDEAVRLVSENLSQVPYWPQLPKRGYKENMVAQYAEAMPCVRVDETGERVYFDTSGDTTSELEVFYENYLNGNLDYFAVSRENAPGFYKMLEEIKSRRPTDLIALKGQVTGPITFGFSAKDEKGRAIMYNETFSDVIIKALSMKACWQVERLKELKVQLVIFFDEPYMVSFGSAYMNISREDVNRYLREVIEPVQKAGAMVGVHCCANTDWSLLFETDVDIISFDAYSYLERMSLYPEDIRRFLNRGGVLAWGIVPTSEFKGTETEEELVKRLEEGIGLLASKGIDKEILLTRCMVTPSCGMGSLTIQQAERIIYLTKEVSRRMREIYEGPLSHM